MLQVAATDASIYERYDPSEVVIFEVASSMAALTEFRDVYGMRFVGLEDQASNIYGAYRVPDPEAPYPQDYVIDQDGIVRYWSWEYDPQEVMRTIDRLLGATGVEDDDPGESAEPVGLRLAPPSPNPFRPGTDLAFELPERARVSLGVYDVSGRLVRMLASGVREPGGHKVRWDGTDDEGHDLASGVYFVVLSDGTTRSTRRAVLLK